VTLNKHLPQLLSLGENQPRLIGLIERRPCAVELRRKSSGDSALLLQLGKRLRGGRELPLTLGCDPSQLRRLREYGVCLRDCGENVSRRGHDCSQWMEPNACPPE
jgi:hypothetical protein